MNEDQKWPSLRRFQERMRYRDQADEALKYAGTPDKPYVQKLTPEEQARKEAIEKAMSESKWPPLVPGGPIYTGPRGGRYRINRNGRKAYDVT